MNPDLTEANNIRKASIQRDQFKFKEQLNLEIEDKGKQKSRKASEFGYKRHTSVI